MPDLHYTDPRLARLYDVLDGDRDDLELYAGIAAELGARRVLDVGCGTGSLAVLLAGRGYEVVGVDPAAASVEVARAKSAEVRWVCGEVGDVGPVGADLAVMTGNVAQVFLTDDEWSSVLSGIAAALRPGGHLVFETRRPQRRAWESWSGERVVGGVRVRREVTEVRPPLVSFDTHYVLADGTAITAGSTLRFRDRDEVTADLSGHGFDVLDVRDAPDRPGLEDVFIARR